MANLILVHQDGRQERADYEEIARLIAAADASISVYIVDTKEADWADAQRAREAPCVTVSPMPAKKFVPPRGPLFQGHNFPKSEQYEKLARIGVRVPRWSTLSPGAAFDAREWGPYVVVKPSLGIRGAEVRVKRTGRVRYHPPEYYPAEHPAHKAPMLVQQFVYTGRWAANYRVVTLFGRTLMSWHCEQNRRFEPLESRWAFESGGITVVSNKRDSTYRLVFEPDVVALAQAAHAAFPDQPLLGTDIVRDAESGELFVLECNPRGDVWLLSSDMGRKIEAANGLDFEAQLGALGIAAEVLAGVTRSRAA